MQCITGLIEYICAYNKQCAEDNVFHSRIVTEERYSVNDTNLFLSCLGPVHSLLKSSFNTVAIEKEKIKQILSDQEQSDQSVQINSLRKSLSQVMTRFNPITHDASFSLPFVRVS